eukprot:TRINITY_DN37173_c0_g1_i1.p1 TRINITY_DN37173_c0_g1~~TRINITY_DN37173_c0_g1_i1.p1  ORF type:complete len:689 (+),score=109.93 TRINITY_DN37173_c0_g1_i1:96-2162(+)
MAMEATAEFARNHSAGMSTDRSVGSQSSFCVRQLFTRRLGESFEHLQRVTGEPEDVKRDEDFAVGDTCLTFKDVSFSVPRSVGFPCIDGGHATDDDAKVPTKQKRKVILEPVSGHYEAGTLVALMGPSGSGKSTLLDILANKKTSPYEGIVHVNGRPRDELFHRISAYVPQEDVMPGHLTVEEVVMFHAALKEEKASKWKHAMDVAVTEKRLKVLGLQDVAKSYVGDPSLGFRGISGGQKRRLSLARGLASGAQLIFCDEPTSGLSATDAEACVRYMRLVAHKYSVTIIVAIHQPRREVGRMFDELLMLTSKPGRVVYSGPMSALPEYAEKIGHPFPQRSNPTDFCMDMITPGIPGNCVDEFVRSFEENCKPVIDAVVERELYHEKKTPMEILEDCRQKMMAYGSMPPLKKSKYGVSFRKQLRWVFMRQLTLRLRDKWAFIGEIGIAIAKAAAVGSAFAGISKTVPWLQVSFFYFALMACSIDGLKTMPKVISERTVMKMETSEALYSEWTYILSFTILSSFQALVAHSVFILVLFSVTGFPWALFPSMWLWTTMLSYVMDSLYLMLSGIAKDATMAQVLSLPFLMMFLLYNGFTAARNTVPWWLVWALEISPVAYALEALTLDAARICREGPPYHACRGEDGVWEQVMHHFAYEDRYTMAFAVMGGCMLVFRATHVVCLKYLNHIQR